MRIIYIKVLSFLFLMSFSFLIQAEETPVAETKVGWRNDGTGKFPKAKPVLEWSASKNVIWKTAMPNWSNSSPTIVKDKIFICSEPDTLICLDRKTGKTLWKKEKVGRKGDLPRTHKSNGHSTQTPVSNGKFVAVVFGTGVVAVYDLDGKEKWVKKVGDPAHKFGISASPLISKGLLIVHVKKLKAFEIETGKEKWSADVKWKWGTSLIHRIGKTDVIFTTQGKLVRASDGKILEASLNTLQYNACVFEKGVAYLIQSNSAAYEIPKTFSLDMKLKTLWTTSIKKDRYYASPLVHKDLIYAVTRKWVLSVLNKKTGKLLYEKELGFKNKDRKSEAYPSISSAGDKIFISSSGGETIVLDAGKEYKEVKLNSLEGFRSSPVFIGDRMYIRGYKNLWCIGKKE